MTWKYEGLPGNPDVFTMVDFGRVDVFVDWWAVSLRFNTSVAARPGWAYGLWELGEKPTVTTVPGSSKAGIPINHPQLRFTAAQAVPFGPGIVETRVFFGTAWMDNWYIPYVENAAPGGFGRRACGPPFLGVVVPVDHDVNY